MRTFTFDGMPQSLASLHEKCDKIIALLSSIASGTAVVTGAGAASIAAVKAGANIASLSVTNSAAGGAVARFDACRHRRQGQ